MAKFKIQAGAEVDMISSQEMRDALKDLQMSWMTELAIGTRYTRFSAQATIANAALDMGGSGPGGQQLGPPPGFIWDVRRLRLTGLNSSDVVVVTINDDQPSSRIATTGDTTGKLFLWAEQVILYPGEVLRITGSSLAATGVITASGQARELPVSLAWRLGG